MTEENAPVEVAEENKENAVAAPEEKEKEAEEEEEDDGSYKIKVKAASGQVTLMPMEEDWSIAKVKELIQTETDTPADNRLVLFKDGLELEGKEGSTLTALGVASRATLELKHRLFKKWTMWYDVPDKSKKPDPNNWHSNVKQIVSFDTVEDFWGLFNNLMTPSRLADKSNYHLFREGIMPAWEDPQNANGGKWSLQLNTSAGEKKLLDEVWLFTMLEMIGEGFTDSDEICGAVISLRKSRNRIAIWTKSTGEEAMKRLGGQFKERMSLGARYKISFTAHHTEGPPSRKGLFEC